MERLTKRGFVFNSHYVASNLQSFAIAECLAKLQEYENLEEDGRLVVLPCKVGDVLYHTILGEIREKTVVSISGLLSQFVRRITIHAQNARGAILPVETWQLGTHVFLTREEAEAALKGVNHE